MVSEGQKVFVICDLFTIFIHENWPFNVIYPLIYSHHWSLNIGIIICEHIFWVPPICNKENLYNFFKIILQKILNIIEMTNLTETE